ncbi:MAG TPA: hypothetical protein VNX29_22990 [Kaistia sp.]|nr:hypothetical protein [Kaistia sp.]
MLHCHVMDHQAGLLIVVLVAWAQAPLKGNLSCKDEIFSSVAPPFCSCRFGRSPTPAFRRPSTRTLNAVAARGTRTICARTVSRWT